MLCRVALLHMWLECNISVQKCYSEEDVFCNILLKLFDRLRVEDYDMVACIAQQIWLWRNKIVFEGEFTHPKKVF
jgi:hypothetical protein